MARFACGIVSCVLVMSLSAADGAVSPVGLDIQSRPYRELSTKLDVGSVIVQGPGNTLQWKASGIVPTVANGLVAWADGRAGEVTIMGFDLTDKANIPLNHNGEFLISQYNNGWQEGNPFVGYDAVNSERAVVYNTVALPLGGDQGNIEGSNLPAAPAQVFWGSGKQLTPVLINPTATSAARNVVGWINHTNTQSNPGYNDTEIWINSTNGAIPPTAALTGSVNITAGSPTRREHLAGQGNNLIWQELRTVGDNPAWGLSVYTITGASTHTTTTLDPVEGKNLTQPDIYGNMLVYTQEENPAAAGNNLLNLQTNVYFRDLAGSAGPIAITTQGTACRPAISKTTTIENGKSIDSYVVVWQDHRNSTATSVFPGGNSETDYNWDIWGQELRQVNGQYALYMDPFLIRSDVGRQTNPDIDGRDVVWQSQAPGSQDIYVWGAVVPEPCTLGMVLVGAALAALRRRARRITL